MSDWDTQRGYSGAAFDQQVGRMERSPLEKVKEQFWTAKQVVRQKLGKKEDDYLIASDAELDAKLELFQSIKSSSGSLMRTANRYQREMHEISKEEYSLGQFLKKHGEQDASRAGIMLNNVAKAFVISAQKRMESRAPLIRLAQDTRTYRRCAVSDTEQKIEQMEEARTEYRGALLWMKDISEELDPDTFKQLEKFRKVQSQVRAKKERFDSFKLDTLQKIDLLSISRLNMLSQSLAPYGSALCGFYEKAATVLSSVGIPASASSHEAELGILESIQRRFSKSETCRKDDDALLDLKESKESQDEGAATSASASDLLDAMWKESGLEDDNFDPLAKTMDGLSLDSADVLDKKDSPDTNTESLFNLSELDEGEGGNMDFLSLYEPVLQPMKMSPTEASRSASASSAKESTFSGLKAWLPSHLMQKGWISSTMTAPQVPAAAKADMSLTSGGAGKQEDKLGKSSWQSLFADLDPLSSQGEKPIRRTDGKEEEGSC